MGRDEPRGLRFLEVIVLLTALGLGLRLFQLQVLRHERYLSLASRQWERVVELPAPRGTLYDRFGTPLAMSSLQCRVSVDPTAWRSRPAAERDALLDSLALSLRRSPKSLRRQLKASGHYAVLDEGISLSLEERERLERTGLVHVEGRTRRLYPLGNLAAPLLGALNAEGAGISGLEAGLESILAGVPGRSRVLKDELGRPLVSARNEVLQPPRRGGDVTITIDHKVQAIADVELARAMTETGAVGGSVVILDPGTGDILALSSWPAPVDRGGETYRPEQWQLRPVQVLHEPGSTLKVVTAVPLLERGGIELTSQEDAEDGQATIDGFRIRDDRPHYGLLTFREAFIHSSNICFAKFSRRIGNDDLFGALQAFGFGNSYGLPLPVEERGLLRKPSQWSRRSRLTLIFGQELGATPLQITAAIAAIANGGRLMRPRLLRAWTDGDGNLADTREPVVLRRVCAGATAERILGLMGEVVTEGTGDRAAVPGVVVGGKTGTAQKFADGQLLRGKYLASFVGVAPLAAPRLVVGVFIDEPESEFAHGGSGAAPVFARIVERLAVSTEYLSAPGVATVARAGARRGRPAPNFLDLGREEAEALAAREALRLSLRGRGKRVVAQEPAPGCGLDGAVTMTIVLGEPEQAAAEPPDLTGLSLRGARRFALERGYGLDPRGSGVVASQGEPGPDGRIPVRLAPAPRSPS